MEPGPARPGPVDLKTGTIYAKWQSYKQRFEIYMLAMKKSGEDTQVKWAYLMGDAGPDALELYNSSKDSLLIRTIGPGGVVEREDLTRNYEAKFDEYTLKTKV